MNNLKNNIAGVVLAAGWSLRMGAFKPLLPFGEGTVLDHVVARLREAGVRQIHVVFGHRAEIMEPKLAAIGVAGVHNPGFDQGMYTSVQAGVGSLPDGIEGCLLLPVDVPLLRVSTIERVLRAAAETGASIVHPAFRGRRGHPPFIGCSLFGEILRGDGNGGLRAVLAAHESGAREIAVFDRGCLSDMDYPEDHRQLLDALVRHHVPDAEECEAMLEAEEVPANIRDHCRAVSAFATRMAERLIAAGVPVDIDLVRAGGLVHDIARLKPHHEEAGAEVLRGFGFPDVAYVVGCHVAVPFDGERIDEAVLVYLADKLMRGDKRVSLTERVAPVLARYAGDAEAIASVHRRLAESQRILRAVEARIGPLDQEPVPS